MSASKRPNRGPRVIKGTPTLVYWLEEMIEATNEILDGDGILGPLLSAEAVKWAQTTSDPRGKAAYMMGTADAYRTVLEAVNRGLREWRHPDTGELIAVDRQGDPVPSWMQPRDPAN